MKLILLSDTHGKHEEIEVPIGDVLIFAGDCMTSGLREYELNSFSEWFNALPHKHKVLIAGNHDWLFQRRPEIIKGRFPNCHYLLDSEVNIGGLTIWGSPYQPEFCNWAFNLPRGPALKAHWDLIPGNVDVLVTHGPPRGILDYAKKGWKNLGDDDLMDAVNRTKPKLHVFGHIHGGAGVEQTKDTVFVNASVVDEAYEVRRPAIEFTL